MTKTHWLHLGKLGLGLGLIVLLLVQGTMFQDTLTVFEELSLTGLLIVLFMPVILVWTSCLKWQLLLTYRGIHVRMGLLMRYYTVGFFFNNFFPSSIGGDVARSYMVGTRIGSQTEAFAAVLLERLTGLFALVLLGVVGFLATPQIQDNAIISGSIAVLAAGCLVLIALLWWPKTQIAPLINALSGLPVIGKVMTKIFGVREALQGFWAKPKTVFLTFAYSFLYHALAVINFYIAAWALGIEINIIGLAAVGPIILVITALPTTPGGLGVWEWACTVLIPTLGPSLEQGLAIALLLRGQLLVASLLGGGLYLFDRRRDAPQKPLESVDG